MLVRVRIHVLFLCCCLQQGVSRPHGHVGVSVASDRQRVRRGLEEADDAVSVRRLATRTSSGRQKRQESAASCTLLLPETHTTPAARFVEYTLTYTLDDDNTSASDGQLVNVSQAVLLSSPDAVLRADRWVQVRGQAGRSLLHLDDNYGALSLGTLAIHTRHATVPVRDQPRWCLWNLSEEDRKQKIRMRLLGFSMVQPASQGGSSSDRLVEVCNLEVTRGTGNQAVFQHVCCSLTSHGVGDAQGAEANASTHPVCYKLTHSHWSYLLTAGIWAVKVFVILFTPSLIPRNLFGQGFDARAYRYQLKRDRLQVPEGTSQTGVASDQTLSLRFKVVKETLTSRILKCGSFPKQLPPKLFVKKMKGDDMAQFLKFLEDRDIRVNTLYKIDVDSVLFSVKRRKLLTRWEIPVGFFRFFYDQFLRCHLRKSNGLETCCQASVCGESIDDVDSQESRNYVPWYKLCRLVARLAFVCVLTLPWLLRVAFYYSQERQLEEDRRAAAHRLGLRYGFTGSLAVYLTPTHGFFLVLYVLSFLFVCAYELFDTAVRKEVKTVLLACLRDLYSQSSQTKRSRCSVLETFLAPVRRRGVQGVPVLCLLTPLVVLYLAYRLFPTLNLSVRLLAYLAHAPGPSCGRNSGRQAAEAEDKESLLRAALRRPHACLPQAVYVILAVLFMWSVTLLAAEFLSFIVEIFIYTLIGIVVNYQAVAGYLPFVISLLVYCRGCFHEVYDVYMKYHRTLFARLLEPVKAQVQAGARSRECRQANTAFRRVGDKADPPETPTIELEEVRKNKLQLRCQGLLVFLDQSDMVYTPEEFFHHTLDLSYHGCPGPFYQNVVRAFIKLAKVVIFLFFALIVVMVFGESADLSFSNQFLLAAVATSLPFVQKLFLRHDSGPNSDYSDEEIQFSVILDEAINNFKVTFPVADLVVKDLHPVIPCGEPEEHSKPDFLLCVPK